MDWSRIRAVALDFDGTLLDPGHHIRPVAREAIRRAAAAGVRVCSASGRELDNQVAILALNELGAETGLLAALCCDERSVWLWRDGQYVAHEPWNGRMEATWARLWPLARELREATATALVAQGLSVHEHLTEELMQARGLADLAFDSEADAVRAAGLMSALAAARTDELMVTQNWGLAMLLARVGGKGRATAEMARALGLRPDEMLAVGDRNNDTPMLDGSAGLAAACVGNAVPEIQALVRSQGGYVAQDELGGGVAEILSLVTDGQRDA